MPDSLANLDLSPLNLDLTTLKAIEQLLNHIELLINEEPENAVTFLYKIKQEIVQLKGQTGKLGTDIIHLGVSELRQSFHAHLGSDQIQDNKSPSSHLLIFYAVECGLKSIWLKRNKLNSTAKIQDQSVLTKDGHNITVWLKKLGISAQSLGSNKIPGFRLERGGSSWDVGKAHQAWRYGVRMEFQDEKVLVEWLDSLCNWIKNNISI
ncbi:MAG: hypothetical protein KME21_27420 [Desmonostoc vinosum HA7617-LM4]|jgi:hypothetical protein|nr:hypothetical protein [Desmonostoc vinosum HA7617-LM4]